ncbi:MAG TPA: SHOCT domain-containing protein [Nakamurella sp.]
MSAPLTPSGDAAVADLAQRYRVSDGAVRALLDAVVRGGGAMAQFSHPELGGSGQWMRGGMTMVGDMFNPGLQATVSGICSELASMMASGTALVVPPDPRSTGSGYGTFGGLGGQWWPAELGRPSSSGGQNDAAYAYFPGTHRLAIRHGEAITLYDTGDHVITGVQQQQGSRGSLEFSSQFGTFTVDGLPLASPGTSQTSTSHQPPTASPAQQPPFPPPVQSQSQSQSPVPAPPHLPPPARATPAPAPPPPPTPPAAQPTPPAAAQQPPPVAAQQTPAADRPAAPPRPGGAATTAAEIGAAIETLAGLRDKGFLSDEEFTAKKAELLSRL